MNYYVQITSHASQQLAETALWWAENSNVDQALKWLEGFETAIASLAHSALQHSASRENDLYDLPYTVRQLLYGVGRKPTHRAVYEIRGGTVYVVAIRHLAQNDLERCDL